MSVRSFNVTDPQNDRINYVLSQTGLTFSELMRRWVDNGLREQVLDEVIPYMSGKLEMNLVR